MTAKAGPWIYDRMINRWCAPIGDRTVVWKSGPDEPPGISPQEAFARHEAAAQQHSRRPAEGIRLPRSVPARQARWSTVDADTSRLMDLIRGHGDSLLLGGEAQETNEAAGVSEFVMISPAGRYSVTVRDTGFDPDEE
jgi:hypothetical protein